jgi:hypothetical protein
MDTPKERFLIDAFLGMSSRDALGRSKTYSKSVSENDKKRFQNALRETLKMIWKVYVSPVNEEEHLSNIKKLSDDLSSGFYHCLRSGRFRIGIAQKALNIFLKYLWCAKRIPEPPHCPFDSIIIGFLPECSDLKWTSIDNMDAYKRLVKVAKKVAKGKSLPEWELEVWSSVTTRLATPVKQKVHDKTVNEGVKSFPPSPHTVIGGIPKRGDVFKGKINDLGQHDVDGWRRRDIWFYKSEVNRNERFNYPTRLDKIILMDTDRNQYKLNFSKPEMKDKVCLGTPSRLKPWYRLKGFNDTYVNHNDFIYFEYTGIGIEFFIFTQDEYHSRKNNAEV